MPIALSMLGFAFRPRQERSEARRRLADDLKARLRDRLRLGPDDGLTLNDVACADPSCSNDVDTFVLVMRRGQRTRVVKIPKPMEAIVEADLDDVLAKISTDVVL